MRPPQGLFLFFSDRTGRRSEVHLLFLPFWTGGGGGGGDRPHSEPARRPSLFPPFFHGCVRRRRRSGVWSTPSPSPSCYVVEAEVEVEVENANTLLTPLPSPSLFSPSPFPFPLWLWRHSAPLSPIQPSSVSPPSPPPPSPPFILCDPESKKDFHPLAETFLKILFHSPPYCMENVSPRPLL